MVNNQSKAGDGIKIVRHPEGHGIDCCVDEKKGLIEIIHGACKTILKIKPGPVDVEYMKSQKA